MTEKSPDLPKIQAPELSGASGVRHAFFTREGGVSNGLYRSLNCGFGSDDLPANVTENRRRICGTLNVSTRALITPYQVHGTDAVIVEKPWLREAAPKADGMATGVPGIALGILTADCAPVLFADTESRVIGACHAGWRGALDGIVDTTVAAMETLGARREQIRASIGPCIAQASYQVGPEFRDQFRAKNEQYNRFFKTDSDGRFRFDLAGFVLDCLKSAGIANAGWVEHDTCADEERLFSYRRSTHHQEPDFGRGLSAIVLSEA